MLHADIRALAFQGDADALRAYGKKFEGDAFRRPNLDALEMVALLSENDFIGAEAKSEELLYKYRDSESLKLIEQVSDLVRAIVDFTFGNFTSFGDRAKRILSFEYGATQVEQNDKLALFKLLAERHFLFDDMESLEKVYATAQEELQIGDRTQAHYLLNSIKALVKNARGEYKESLHIADQNITIARQNNYQNVASAVAMLYVRARSLTSMGRHVEADQAHYEVRAEAMRLKQWPWYFASDGYLSREHAYANRMTEALAIIREEREMIKAFPFKNDLTVFPDGNELFVRYMLQDVERMEILIGRLPKLRLVEQIKNEIAFKLGKLSLQAIQALPESTIAERIYKGVWLLEYFQDQESVAVGYARKILEMGEESGAVEIILLQDKLFGFFIKAALRKPTAFMEDIVRMIPERIKKREETGRGELVEALTNRELEVVQHLATGKPISAIAGTLHVSMNTMKTHLRNTYRKLEVDGREGAVARAKELFLI